MSEPSIPHSRAFPLPVWALAAAALALEVVLYAILIAEDFFRHSREWAGVAVVVACVLAARFVIALASYSLSRWKGDAIPPEAQLGAMGWLRFFFVEYGHLCIQNLLLIPFRRFFRTATECGRGPESGPVVLMQHGYVNNGGVWYFTARALERQGYRVFTLDQPVFASIDLMGDRLATRIEAVLATTESDKLILVAHSMGGLICRAYLRRHGDTRIERLVTLSSPHHGTFHAYLAGGPNGQQMRPGNPWITELGRTLVTVPFTSIYSVHDTVISPQSSSIMKEAQNVRMVGVGHVSMPGGRTARSELLRALPK
jgi:pimeloyl-ACP methyl ester carboxylesterase